MSCSHEAVYKGVCITCGFVISDLPIAEQQAFLKKHTTSMVLSGATGSAASSDVVMLSETGLEKKRTDNTRRLLRTRRLALVLDLDHTLVHATDSIEMEKYAEDPTLDVHSIIISPPSTLAETLPPKKYTIAFRPGSREFLQLLSPMFELSVLTMGERSYADAVVNLLDPDGTLIQGRVVSRDELPDKSAKNLSVLLPCDEDLVTILDDRDDVWPGLSTNVVKLLPFKFFINASEAYDRTSAVAGEKTVAPKPTQVTVGNENKISVSPKDNILASLLPLFISLHTLFFAKVPIPRDLATEISKIRARLDVDSLPVFTPQASSNSMPVSSHASVLAGKRPVVRSVVSNIDPIRLPVDVYTSLDRVLNRKDVILGSHQSVSVLLSLATKSIFRSVRLSFTETGFNGRRPQGMLEYGVATKCGAIIIPLPDFQALIQADREKYTQNEFQTDEKSNIPRTETGWSWDTIPTHVISVSTSSPEALNIAQFNKYCQTNNIIGPSPKLSIQDNAVKMNPTHAPFKINEIDPAWVLASAAHFVRQPEELFVPRRQSAQAWLSNQKAMDPTENGRQEQAMSESDYSLLLRHSSDLRAFPITVTKGSLGSDYIEAALQRKWDVLVRHGPYCHSIGSMIELVTSMLVENHFLAEDDTVDFDNTQRDGDNDSENDSESEGGSDFDDEAFYKQYQQATAIITNDTTDEIDHLESQSKRQKLADDDEEESEEDNLSDFF